jgi:hypothetical protein
MMNDQRGFSLWPLVIVLTIGCVPAYFVWPSGIMDTPLSAVTVGDFFRMIAMAAVLLVAAVTGAMLSDWN